MQLALACDLRVGGASAQFAFTEGRLGLLPAHGGVARLVKLVGLIRAPQSYGLVKRLLLIAACSDLTTAIATETIGQSLLIATDDHREGRQAMHERRPPRFRGR